MTIKDAPLLPIASELLSKVFKGMNSKGINFIVLRNYKKLPISWRNDIDILVEPNSLDKAHELILKIFSVRLVFVSAFAIFRHLGIGA